MHLPQSMRKSAFTTDSLSRAHLFAILLASNENRNHWLNKPSSCKSIGCYTDDQRSCSVWMLDIHKLMQIRMLGSGDESKEAFFSAVASCYFLLQGTPALGGQPRSQHVTWGPVKEWVTQWGLQAERSRAGGERAGRIKHRTPGDSGRGANGKFINKWDMEIIPSRV